MYLEEINDENLGPINQLKIKMDFNDNDETNYALSKKIFANNIYEEKGEFSKLSYESFKDIFYIIKEILGK